MPTERVGVSWNLGGVRDRVVTLNLLAGDPDPSKVTLRFGTVPVALAVVRVVPGYRGRRLPLAARSVTDAPRTAFAANYVHDDPKHLHGDVAIHLGASVDISIWPVTFSTR